MKMTYKEAFEQLSEKDKERLYFIAGALKALKDADANGEFEDVDEEVEHSEEIEAVDEQSEENSLVHYGVLGMKWGIRKYQNPDGSLTAKGKKRYGEGGQYEYKSHGTKKLEKRVDKLSSKLDKANASGDTNKAAKLSVKLEKKENRLKAGKILDKAYQDYAKTTSTGKAIVQNLLFGSWGARAYQQGRALGYDRITSALMGVASNTPLANMVSRYGYRRVQADIGSAKDLQSKVKNTAKKL